MLPTVLVLMQLGMGTPSATWVVQPVGTTSDLHVVKALDSARAWAAGTNGSVIRTVDAGKTWFVNIIYSCTSCKMSGLVAQDADTAVVSSGGRPARIYVTGNGGQSWTLRYESNAPESRVGGLAFFDSHRGFAVGGIAGSRVLLLHTTDGGATWTEAPTDAMPEPLPGEHLADVSGGPVAIASGKRALIGTSGGSKGARVLRSDDGGATWKAFPTHLSTINGIAFSDERTGIAVGVGRNRTNVIRTTDGGATWSEPSVAGLPGPREGISLVPGTAGRIVVTVGPSGSTHSTDGGATWKVGDKDPAHAVSFAGLTDAGWKVGDSGFVKKLLAGATSTRLVGQATPVPVHMGQPVLGRTAPQPAPPPGATPTPLGIHLRPTPAPQK